MRSVVALLRLLGLFAYAIGLFPFGLATRLPRLFGGARASIVWGARVQRVWARGCLALMGVRVVAEGEPPRGRYLVAVNHLSYLDILVLARLFPGRFVAKSEIAGWPLLGWLSRSVGTIFVVQGRRRDLVRVGEEMSLTLDAGVPVVLFPEGGASRGAEVLRFHTSLFEVPARLRIPCLAVALHYATPGSVSAAAYTACWWGGMGLWLHVWRLLTLPGGVVARVRWAPAPLVGDDRKELAAGVRAALLERFEPVAQEPVPSDFPWPALLEDGLDSPSAG